MTVLSKKMFLRASVVPLLLLAAVAGMLVLAEGSPQVDPFYSKRLSEGEKLFREGQYKESVSHLTIAAFGLSGETSLLARAYAYLALAHQFLKEQDKADEYLNRLIALIGPEGLELLSLDEAAKNQLISWSQNKGLLPPPGQKSDVPKSPAEKRAEKEKIKDLEKKVKNNPNDASFSFELYRLYVQEGDIRSARRVLEGLVKRDRRNLQAQRELGRLLYGQKKYKEASRYFADAATLSLSRNLADDGTREALAYLILCHAQRKEWKAIEKACRDFWRVFPDGKVDSLMLDAADATRLRSLLQKYPPMPGERPSR